MKRRQGRPRVKRDLWDFEGPYRVEPFYAWYPRPEEDEE